MNDFFFSECENLLGSTHVDMTVDPPVLIPPTEDLLCRTVQLADKENCKIRIIGGGTMPVSAKAGQAIPVSLAGLSAVIDVTPPDFVVVSQAGTIVDHAVEEAGKMNLHLPLDITSGAEATVGGAFMTGSLGPSSAVYGPFRKAVIGVRCVSANGKVVRFGGRTSKNVTGYDLTWFLGGTMGLYAIAVELTIKVNPLPEVRIAAVARYKPGSKPFETVLPRIAQVKQITSLEFAAPNGLGGEITIGAGIEGMEIHVSRCVHTCEELMDSSGLIEFRKEDYDVFFKGFRRHVSKNLVDSGFFTVSIPPSASEILLERLFNSMPSAPVIAHPLMGRYHVVCGDTEAAALEKISLTLGGKVPTAWGTAFNEGISGFFSRGELELARSLKRELDPAGLLNPHLKL